ncbi:hydantoinase B/oxoprolinase family protein [Hydrogenimonas sp.]
MRKVGDEIHIATVECAIDRGGTFTDLIARYGERFVVKKVLSRSPFYEESCSHAIGLAMKELFGEDEGIDAEKIAWVRMGTTIATNALLERKGEPTALAVTKGFGDLLRIGDQSRPDIFALEIKKPEPLYDAVVEIDERVFVEDGEFVVEKAVDEAQVRQALGALKVKNLAVCLMHGYGYEDHEKSVKAIAESMGFTVVCSHELSPLPGVLGRAETTLVDAYLTPKLRSYLHTFQKPFRGDIASRVRMMQSDGSLCKMADFRGSRALLSGPAGGVAALAGLYKGKPLIGFDMGGTSTDVCRYDGAVELGYESETAGVRVRVPQVALHTVASGGGSRLFFENGLFKVGPQSSGAEPGPLCYGRGGYLSVTDANLVTGRLDPERFPKIFGPDGDAPLDTAASRAGFAPIAEAVGRSVEEVAEAFLQVADEQMARAVKEVTLKKGFDPADHTLCAFGGAGGQHAVSVAAKLGVEEVLVHRYAGILSAWGMALADETIDRMALVQKPLEMCDASLFAPLEASLPAFEEEREVALEYLARVKYEGTETALEVPFERAKEAFEARHGREFGFVMPERRLMLESIRLVARIKSRGWRRPRIAPSRGVPEPLARRPLFIDGAWHEAALYDAAKLGAGDRVAGPALLMQENATIVLPPDAVANVDDYGDIRIAVPKKRARESDIEAAKLALLANRFGFIASRMGEMLRRSAVSTNIKERLDFSCAIFDATGNLVANAPHIPVHLGSMSSVVKALIAKYDTFEEGVQFVTNAPWEGGSHLPDITVAAPCVREGRVLFWVASRGHHADIGGSVPGSMPPFSTALQEEGVLFESFVLVRGGRFDDDRVRALLKKAGARRIDDNLSDLRAQAAANREGIAGVLALTAERSEAEIARYMAAIQQVSEGAVRDFLKSRSGRTLEGSDRLDNGCDIRLLVRIDEEGGALFDFTGTSPEIYGNQNTPPAVVRSAVVYALRAMLRKELPLNEGLVAPVRLVLPENSMLRPSKEAAVSGGNVTTSQRIVDLILGLLGEAAASQGCMNNVIFGDETFGYYETIGGGAGATRHADGADAVHTHMTNTRITDAEIFERRFPVAIETFAVREGTGGAGRHRGGDGIVRVYRFFKPLAFAIVSERRVFAPFGLENGGPGARGRNLLVRAGKPFVLGSRVQLTVQKGDRVRIETPGGGGYGKIENGE